MDPHELNRMFDRLAPTAEQEQAVLDRLLQTERKVYPMKKLKKWAAAGIAAVLVLVTCAAAVATGIDQRLLDFMGWGQHAQELLAPGAISVDVTTEDNGAALHVSQVLMDRYSILILADFTAPEGTVLDMAEELGSDVYRSFGGLDGARPDLLDRAGDPIELEQDWGMLTSVLDDGDPLDNRLTLLLRMDLSDGIQPDWEIAGLSLPAKNLVRYDPEAEDIITVYSGDWSCQFPVPWQDIGQRARPNQVAGHLDGADITVTEVYLSPMTLQIQLLRETPVPRHSAGATEIYQRWVSAISGDRVTLTTKDGQPVPLTELGGSSGDQEQNISFQLDEVTALEDLRGGTLTLRIGGGSVDIPLNDLAPAE